MSTEPQAARNTGSERSSIGQAVQVTRGACRGLTGVMEGIGEDQTCLIRLALEQRGVLLVVAAGSVRGLADRPAFAHPPPELTIQRAEPQTPTPLAP